MPEGKLKSRSSRRVFIKTPGKENKIHYKERKNSKKKCTQCGAELHGIPHLIESKFRGLPKTKKRPQRPYAGTLCSKCMRKKVLERVM